MGRRELLFTEYRVSVWDDENFWVCVEVCVEHATLHAELLQLCPIL